MIPHFFIDRPIFAAVISLVITLTGGIALFYLPIAQYPQITPPSVQVSINCPPICWWTCASWHAKVAPPRPEAAPANADDPAATELWLIGTSRRVTRADA